MPDDGRRVLDSYIAAVNARDWSTASSLMADDYIEDWPQTGERVRGLANLRAIFERYPGALAPGAFDEHSKSIIGTEDRYVLSPLMTVLRIDGGGEIFTVTYTAAYPDGVTWFVVMIARITEGRLRRAHTYFAPTLPAPEWRKPWVGPIEVSD